MARLNRQQSAALIRAALDSGITHFDTARLYGYGEAESVLGEVLAGQRASVTITSKVGILPPKRSGVLTVARSVARKLASLHPSVHKALHRRAQAMVQGGAFDIPGITRSLETSLRELRTDYLDILLLHECRKADLERPELLEFLDAAKRKGMIRHYGIATSIEETEAAFDAHPAFTGIVQIANNAWNTNADRLRTRPLAALITHSALGPEFNALMRRLAADPALRRSWSERLGLDAGDRGGMGRVFLAYALQANSQGTVLFSSSKAANIRDNVLLLRENGMSAERMDALAALIRADVPSTPGAIPSSAVAMGSA